jgi:transcriptional regulator with XRE-family HTH domain
MEKTEMKDRIAHIIRAQNTTAADFALRLGIQPSNISHLLSGRNNPSLDFVKKLKETFPEYSLDWIIFGNGPMTVSEPFAPLPSAEPSSPLPVQEEKTAPGNDDRLAICQDKDPNPEPLPPIHHNLKQIVLVYEDQTYEVLSPR